MRRLTLLGCSALALAMGAPTAVLSAPPVTPPELRCNVIGVPVGAQQRGFGCPLVHIGYFDRNIDYHGTFKFGYDAHCYQAFGGRCTLISGSFTGVSPANGLLVVTNSSAGVVAPWEGIPEGSPINGGTLGFDAVHILSQTVYPSTTTTTTAAVNAVNAITVAACPSQTHQYQAVFDQNVGTPGTQAALVGYVFTCTGTSLLLAQLTNFGITIKNNIAIASGDVLDFGGGNGTYQLDSSPTIAASTALTSPTFWPNAHGSMTYTEDWDTFESTVSLASQVSGVNYVGRTIRGPQYVTTRQHWASDFEIPSSGPSWDGGVWATDACSDMQNFACMTPPGQSLVTHNARYTECLDAPETFNGIPGFTNGPNYSFWHCHDYTNYDSGTVQTSSTDQAFLIIPTLGSFHDYGFSLDWTQDCGYFDGAVVPLSCNSFNRLSMSIGNASGSFTTSSTQIPMSVAPPILPQAGQIAIDKTASNQNLGIVAGYGSVNGALLNAGSQGNCWPAASCTVNVNHAIAAGHLVLLSVYDGLTPSGTGCGIPTDAATDTFTKYGEQEMGAGSGNGYLCLFYTYTAGLSNAGAVTYNTVGAASRFLSINVTEAGGMVAAGADGVHSAGFNNTGGTQVPSGNITPTTNGDLIVGIAGTNTFNALTQSSGGFAAPPPTFDHDAIRTLGGNLIQATAGAIQYNPGYPAGITSQGAASIVAAFKVTAGGTVGLNLQNAPLINSAGAADVIQFSWAPPVNAQTAYQESAQLDFTGGQNLKLGTGPQHPHTISDLLVLGPMGSFSDVTRH